MSSPLATSPFQAGTSNSWRGVTPVVSNSQLPVVTDSVDATLAKRLLNHAMQRGPPYEERCSFTGNRRATAGGAPYLSSIVEASTSIVPRMHVQRSVQLVTSGTLGYWTVAGQYQLRVGVGPVRNRYLRMCTVPLPRASKGVTARWGGR